MATQINENEVKFHFPDCFLAGMMSPYGVAIYTANYLYKKILQS